MLPVPGAPAFQTLLHAAGQPLAAQIIHVSPLSLSLTFLTSQSQTPGANDTHMASEAHRPLSVVVLIRNWIIVTGNSQVCLALHSREGERVWSLKTYISIPDALFCCLDDVTKVKCLSLL